MHPKNELMLSPNGVLYSLFNTKNQKKAEISFGAFHKKDTLFAGLFSASKNPDMSNELLFEIQGNNQSSRFTVEIHNQAIL